MSGSLDVLKLRILLCFLESEEKGCTVTGIAKILGEEKYTISRMLMALEKDGLVDRTDIRNPKMTEKGTQEAKRYAERIEITLNRLLYEGVDLESARSDSFYWALYSTDKTMETVRATEQRYRIKYELRGQSRFSGDLLCRRFQDGSYQFPFLIYREKWKEGSNLSMANNGFEHLCVLYIENGVGVVRLRAVRMNQRSALTGKPMAGRVKNLQYLENGVFYDVEKNGDIISFPASALNFINIGSGSGQMLHGSVCLKMECSVGEIHMPQSKAIFTLFI